MADFDLGVALDADTSGFNRAMDGAAKKSADAFSLIYDSAKNYLGMAGVAGSFARATHEAGKFYQAVAEIGAISGQSLSGVDELLLGIDSRISGALSSANTMYEVFSSGIDGTNKEIADLTEIIGKTAAVIRADIVSTGDAMTTIMNAWGISATEATKIMDGLFITVREGKAHGDELARTFGLVTATASAMGTELDDLFAAVAILSRTQSASQAMIGLNQMLNAIIKPTMEAKAAANKWGIELSASAIQTKGLSAVLTELHDKVGGNVEALEAMFGNIRAGRAILALTGEQFSDYIKVLDEMRGKEGSAEEAFKKQMNTMRAETERFNVELNKTLITVGKDTEAITTVLAKMGSAVLESFRASSSGIGDFYNDISAVMGLTSRFDESLSKDIKTLQRYTLYVMGALRFVKMLKDQFDNVTKSLARLREDGTGPGGGDGGGGPKAPTPSPRTSRMNQDAVAADALNAALQRVADTLRIQVNPSMQELNAAFRTAKRTAKATDTAVTDLAGKVNKATVAVGKLKAAIKETNTNLGATSKAITAIATGLRRVSERVVGINTALTGTKSRLMDIRTSQTIIANGYKAHTTAINATNLALTRQIALLKAAQAAMAGSVAGGPKAKRPTTKRGKDSQPAQPAAAPVVTADAPRPTVLPVTKQRKDSQPAQPAAAPVVTADAPAPSTLPAITPRIYDPARPSTHFGGNRADAPAPDSFRGRYNVNHIMKSGWLQPETAPLPAPASPKYTYKASEGLALRQAIRAEKDKYEKELNKLIAQSVKSGKPITPAQRQGIATALNAAKDKRYNYVLDKWYERRSLPQYVNQRERADTDKYFSAIREQRAATSAREAQSIRSVPISSATMKEVLNKELLAKQEYSAISAGGPLVMPSAIAAAKKKLDEATNVRIAAEAHHEPTQRREAFALRKHQRAQRELALGQRSAMRLEANKALLDAQYPNLYQPRDAAPNVGIQTRGITDTEAILKYGRTVAPGARIDSSTAELKALRKEGIGIKNGDRLFNGFAKNVSSSLKDIFGGGIDGVFNAMFAAQTAAMAYQLGKKLDERFGVSDTISDDVTGFKAYTAQQKREAIGATAADISRFIGNDTARGSSAKLSTTEARSYLSRAMRANTPEEIGKLFGELKDLTAERETPQERQSRQRKQLEERLAEDIAKYEAIKNQVETNPSQVITARKMGAMTAYLAGERGKAPEALSGYIERDFSRASGIEKGSGWFGSYGGLGDLKRIIPIYGLYESVMGLKDAFSDEKQKEEYNKAIDLVEAQVANTNDNPTAWRDFTLALAAGNLDKAGIAGQTKYTQEAVKAIVAAMGSKLRGETPTKEELDKHLSDAKKVPVKTKAELINEGVVSSFQNIDIAYTTKMLDMGMELAGSYTGFGRGDFANRAVEAAQANYDALAQALEDKQKEYDAAFAKHLSMGKTPEEAKAQLAGNAKNINTALVKLTEAESGIYGALDKKRAALEKKIQDDIAALIGVRSIVLRRPTTLNEEAGKAFLDAVYAGNVDNAEKKMDALIAAKNAASLDPSTKNLNAVKIAQEESDAAEEAVLDANISRGEYAKAISGQKIAMLQMQMEGAGIDKGMGLTMGATELQAIQRTMLKGIEEEAKGMYERASKDLEENGQDSMFSPVEVEEFKLNMKRASAALIDFTKNLDNARDRTQQAVMAGVQSFTDMKDLRGDLNATALYHSINFMARLTPPERLLGSIANPRAEVPEALNFKNATDAQAGVARALDAYVMSQQYRQAGLATTVENIYNTLRTGNTIVVR